MLEELDLSCKRIGNGGAVDLATALRTHSRLEQLDLAYNRIGNQRASALEEALTENDRPAKLNLRGNLIRSCHPFLEREDAVVQRAFDGLCWLYHVHVQLFAKLAITGFLTFSIADAFRFQTVESRPYLFCWIFVQGCV